jgi:hypothetical protein
LKGAEKMHNAIGISRKTTAALLGVSAAGFIFNSIIYIMLHQKISLGQDITAFTDRVSVYVGISTILLLLFHFAAIATTLLTLRVAKKDSVLQSFIFFLSIISTVMIAGDFALCSDIVKEYGAGLIEGIFSEVVILYFSQLLHLLFYAFAIVLILITSRKTLPDNGAKNLALKDEAIFLDVQYVGIFTSIMGLAILVALSLFTPLWAIKKGIITLCIVLLLPYAMIVAYWILLKIREKITEWYDEKQFQDVTRASFISLIASMLILAVFFLIQNLYTRFALMNVIWFPLYFFMTLLVFSSIVLYLNKKAGE